MSHFHRSSPAPDTPPARITHEGLREVARLFAYLLPYRLKFVAALVSLFLASLLGLAFPYFTGGLIDSAHHGLVQTSPSAATPISTLNINHIALSLLIVIALQGLFSFLQTYWLAEVGERSLA